MEFNPANNNIYVSSAGSENVSVIDSTTNTVIDTIEVGENPQVIEFNLFNNDIYVANGESNTISVIQPPVIKSIADAGPDQTVDSSVKAQMDGSGSSDSRGCRMTIFKNFDFTISMIIP